MRVIKKSLRAKFTLILSLVGVIPLLISGVFFYITSKEAFFENVYKELRWNVNNVSETIGGLFNESARDLLLASQNAAFRMYFEDRAGRAHWAAEQRKTLKQLRKVYPDMMDEACFIDETGQEIARIVFDTLAKEHELSPDEEGTRFFAMAFAMNEGEAFQGLPEISADTHRWVLPMATPIVVRGKKAAILHFELNMEYFQTFLKRSINPDRGYGFIINDNGEFVANTLLDISPTGQFPHAVTSETPIPLMNVYKMMMEGKSGIEEFSLEGKTYYISYRPVATTPQRGFNENRWSIGYVIAADKVYVEASIVRYNILSVAVTLFLVLIIANVTGNYITRPIRNLVDATKKVAAGEMPSIDIRSADEIGQLSSAFNVMAEAVKRRDAALKDLAVTDGLTALFNHRHFKAELEKAFKSAQRYKRPLSLIMADVDYFKHYNDEHGHTYGDTTLKKVAGVILKNAREVDIAARYGGEEFALILPETDAEGALVVAERIRMKVEEEDFPFEESQPDGDLTISAGVASVTEDMKDEIDLINAADKALYRAKELGRNRVCRG